MPNLAIGSWQLALTKNIDYVYEEKRINFRTAFQMHMVVIQKR